MKETVGDLENAAAAGGEGGGKGGTNMGEGH